MTVLSEWSATLTTNCQCMDEDPETGEDREAEGCHGCDEWQLEDANWLLAEWLERNDYPDAVLIQGVAMGWRRLSGYALVRQAGDKIAAATLDKLMLNGDFTIELKLRGKACHAVRYSHDEPTGASFELHAFTPCDGWSECQAVDGIKEYEGVNLCAYCREIQEANN
jgi:hypothetical protein